MKFPSIVALFAVTNVVYAAAKPLPPYRGDLKWEAPRSLSNWSNLTVQTRRGTFIGILNDTYPNVRQFLRVPFAQVSVSPRKEVFAWELTFSTLCKPPVGDLRWMPPQKLPSSRRKYDATTYGPGMLTWPPRIDPLLMLVSFQWSQPVRSTFNRKTRSGKTTNRLAL